MKIVADKKTFILYFQFKDGDQISVKIDSVTKRSILNKIEYLIKDFEVFSQFDGFEEDYKKVLTKYSDEETVEKLIGYARQFVETLDYPYEEWADKSKSTKNSVFFEVDEIKESLVLISVIKLLTPILHSSQYSNDVLDVLSVKFKELNKKLFKMIKYKLKFNFFDRNSLQFLKYAMSSDYLILYNFDFVMLSSISFYDFNVVMNPISFILSIAADNANFLTMSYSQQVGYTEEIDDITSKEDILYQISDQLLINKILHSTENLLMSKGINVYKDLYVTPIFDNLVVPILTKVTGISKELFSKIEDKFYLQWFLYYIVSRNEVLKKEFYTGRVLLLYGFDKIYSRATNISPAILRIFRKDIHVEGLRSKHPFINYIRELSLLHKPLYHISNRSLCKLTREEITEAINNTVDFVVLTLFTKKGKEEVLPIFRKEIYEVLRHDKITEKEYLSVTNTIS